MTKKVLEGEKSYKSITPPLATVSRVSSSNDMMSC